MLAMIRLGTVRKGKCRTSRFFVRGASTSCQCNGAHDNSHLKQCRNTPPPAKIESRGQHPPVIEPLTACLSHDKHNRSLLVGWLALYDLYELVIPSAVRSWPTTSDMSKHKPTLGGSLGYPTYLQLSHAVIAKPCNAWKWPLIVEFSLYGSRPEILTKCGATNLGFLFDAELCNIHIPTDSVHLSRAANAPLDP